MSRTPGNFLRAPTPAGVVLATRRFPRITWSDRAGSHHAIVQQRMVVGASAAADLVLDDLTVSRVHAELDPRDDGLWIRDLASKNGTLVGGERVPELRVRDQCELRLGRTSLIVDYHTGTSAPVELWPTDRFQHMVGLSPVMRELFAFLARVAKSDASILIHGETGTGKEVVARSIHDASPRRQSPLVVVDCAALPENLLDAELFGHTKGAFTGAAHARSGAIESADGGTVFLDEIGELPMSMQPKLLRVLEQRTVRRIGDAAHRPVNVRFVSATHRDLLSMVSRGEFREDLYFRLCVIPITVPPLRERTEDIDLLVNHFLRGGHLSAELVSELKSQPWRGNVRELRNFVERACALGESKVRQLQIRSERPERDASAPAPRVSPRTQPTLPPPAAKGPSQGLPKLRDDGDGDGSDGTKPIGMPDSARLGAMSGAPLDDGCEGVLRSGLRPPAPREVGPLVPGPSPLGAASLMAFEGPFKSFRERWIDLGEREYLKSMLERHRRNVAALAREAGVDRTYIYRLMRKHGL